jgi:hypothetical protein
MFIDENISGHGALRFPSCCSRSIHAWAATSSEHGQVNSGRTAFFQQAGELPLISDLLI